MCSARRVCQTIFFRVEKVLNLMEPRLDPLVRVGIFTPPEPRSQFRLPQPAPKEVPLKNGFFAGFTLLLSLEEG